MRLKNHNFPRKILFTNGCYAEWISAYRVYVLYNKNDTLFGATADTYEGVVLLTVDLDLKLVNEHQPD